MLKILRIQLDHLFQFKKDLAKLVPDDLTNKVHVHSKAVSTICLILNVFSYALVFTFATVFLEKTKDLPKEKMPGTDSVCYGEAIFNSMPLNIAYQYLTLIGGALVDLFLLVQVIMIAKLLNFGITTFRQ